MINLFNINEHIINTGNYTNLLHDNIVNELEEKISDYVGAKYAISLNSATSALFLALQNKNITIEIPSMIPPVVLNAIITSGNNYIFKDDIDWVGNSYVLHDFGDYKIVDSAQKIVKNQFISECNDNDLMVFSFYPTKPVGSCDGGMIVTNDKEKYNHLKSLALNGMSYSHNNWDREIKFPGYKMYMNSLQADIALKNFNLYENKLNKLEEIRKKYNKSLGYENTSNHLYRIDVDDRDEYMKYMKNNGVITGVHYESTHLNPIYALEGTKCPLSEEKSLKTVSIPFHEQLTIGDINFIIDLNYNYSGRENK